MKKTRFTDTQIVAILKEADAGMKVADICRKHGTPPASAGAPMTVYLTSGIR